MATLVLTFGILLTSAFAQLPMRNPCRGATKFASMPFCNATLPIDVRVADAVSRLSIDEKITALNTNSGALPSLGLNAYNWWSEATAGVCSGLMATTHFAYPITTGMSFNRSMWKATGAQIGRETRAVSNAGKGYSTFWTPVINLARDPRWGRNIETPGEDPMLTSEYAEHFVRGFQEAPEDPYHLQASACCKHYVANEMEMTYMRDGEHNDRYHVDSNISMQDLVDSYMRPFQACVEKGRVSSLMCSYNSVNGKPSCANDWLLQTVARDNWGFDGYITSDCDADSDVFKSHHYTATPEEAVRDVLRAGTDVDCGNFVSDNAKSALAKGLITEKDIDARLRMLFRVRMRLNHFDPVSPLDNIPTSIVCSDYALDLSLDGVRQSATLLKNDGSLPLALSSVGKVAIIGPNANYSKKDAGYYGPTNLCGGNFWNLVDSVALSGAQVVSTLGIDNASTGDLSGIPAAVEMAKDADTVLLALGTELSWAQEGKDATSITFSNGQVALIEQVSAAAKKPVIVVLMTSTPLDLSSLLANNKIGAILHVGQPSVSILGIRELLFGQVSPAGRTIQTMYPASYNDEISIFDFGMRPGPSPFARPDCTDQDPRKCPRGTNPGRTYRFYTGQAVIPFGFGLSYSSFSYVVTQGPTALSLAPLQELLQAMNAAGHFFLKSKAAFAAEEGAWRSSAAYFVNVTNTGARDADDVVLGFLTPPGAGQNGVPLRTLFGFERVHVKAGRTVTVTLYPALTDFAQADTEGQLQLLSGDYRVHFGVAETAAHGMGYAEAGTLTAAVGEVSYVI